MEMLIRYLTRLAPAVVPAAACLFFLPKGALHWRLFVYILLFIVMRDTMSPVGLWHIHVSVSNFTIGFVEQPLVLYALAASCGALCIFLQSFEESLARVVVWVKKPQSPFTAVVVGAACGVGIAMVPLLLAGTALRVPSHSAGALLSIAAIAFVGNCFEEMLFRGYVFGVLTQYELMSPVRAGILSGLLFSLCHIFLACSVGDAGLLLLLFTAWEGVACGLLAAHYGLLASCCAHGTAIWLLCVM